MVEIIELPKSEEKKQVPVEPEWPQLLQDI
jgi:hypothetical protein